MLGLGIDGECLRHTVPSLVGLHDLSRSLGRLVILGLGLLGLSVTSAVQWHDVSLA